MGQIFVLVPDCGDLPLQGDSLYREQGDFLPLYIFFRQQIGEDGNPQAGLYGPENGMVAYALPGRSGFKAVCQGQLVEAFPAGAAFFPQKKNFFLKPGDGHVLPACLPMDG